MDDILLPMDKSVLFQGEGQLSEEDILFLEEEYALSPVRSKVGEISTLFRAKSHFSIGEPIVLSLTQLLKKQGTTTSADIRLQLKHYEFYQVQLACSFQAAPGCRFHDTRFGLALQTLPINSLGSQGALESAIVYDMFPLRIEDECKVIAKRNLTPNIKFNFDPVSLQVNLPIYEKSEEYITYKNRIEAFDLQGTQPAWSFMRTEAHEVGGPQRLFMLIRKPRGMQVHVTFSLTARIQFMIGNIALDTYPLRLLFRTHSNHILSEIPTHPLC